MDREHVIIIIARMYQAAERLSHLDFQDADMNTLRDDLVSFANNIHSISRQKIDTGDKNVIAKDAETVSEWIHSLMNSHGVVVNKELEYVIRQMASHWGIGSDRNVFVFSHGSFSVTHFNKIASDPLALSVLESRLGMKFSKEPRIVQLPQLYDGDLLFSTILFHEVGHMVERDNGIAELIYPFVLNQFSSKPSGKVVNSYFKALKDNKKTTPDMIKSYIKEYVADLFGCQYLGKHILEFVKYKESSGRNVDREDHPTLACRERIVNSMVDYMNSRTHTTDDIYLNKIIEVFHNLGGIDDLCQHYIIHQESFLEQDQIVAINTEEELFSLFNLGWRVAIKGQHSLEHQRGLANGTLSYNDYYTQINDWIRHKVSSYMMTH